MLGQNKNQTTITKKTKIKEKKRIVDPQYQTNPTLYQQPHLLGNQPVMGPHMVQPRDKAYSSSSSSSSQGQRQMQNMPAQNYQQQVLIPPRQNVIVNDPNMMNTGQINPQVSNMMMPNQGLQGQGVFLPNQDVKYTHKQEIDQPGEKISFVEKVKQKFRH